MSQHCWEGTCDGLASCPGESVQLHPTKLLPCANAVAIVNRHGHLRHTAWGRTVHVLTFSSNKTNHCKHAVYY